jgi:hypothetical protein
MRSGIPFWDKWNASRHAAQIYFLVRRRVQHQRPMAFAAGRTHFSQAFRRAIRSPLFLSMAALWILLVAMESARPCFFLHDDNATWFSGAYVHDFRVLSGTGRVAVVNYYQYGGEPFLEQGQTAVLYPPVYLGVALAKWISGDLRWSIEWIAAMHLTLGLLGFYFWLRQGRVLPWHAALGGLAWVLNPFVLIVAASWITVIYVAAWLPWLFWAVDRLWNRPGADSALGLGAIAALLFLQGYVQWTAYALLFLGIYVLLLFIIVKSARRLAITCSLAISALTFLILILPLLLPMLHATETSAVRSQPFSIETALSFSIPGVDFFYAQFLAFRGLAFGTSTVVLFCPALLLFPVILFRFFRERSETRQRLFPLLILSLLALLFSTRWHVLLSMLPVLDRFRWPFKVFVFADFFLLASLAWTVSSWAAERATSRGKSNLVASICLGLVLMAELAVSLSHHDSNTFSKTALPSGTDSALSLMDARRGRVIAIDDHLPEAQSSRFFTHAYSTFFQVPSLGGYDPLVGRDQLVWALGLDFPNVFTGKITPEVRKQLEARAVRYWIFDSHSPEIHEVDGPRGFRAREWTPDRMILEDMMAAPLVYSETDPTKPCALTYLGNSILIPLNQTISPLEISVGPTDGWWYRIDDGPWLRGVYQDDRLQAEFPPSAKLLEVSFFDARFREGFLVSGYLSVLLALILAAQRFIPALRKAI